MSCTFYEILGFFLLLFFNNVWLKYFCFTKFLYIFFCYDWISCCFLQHFIVFVYRSFLFHIFEDISPFHAFFCFTNIYRNHKYELQRCWLGIINKERREISIIFSLYSFSFCTAWKPIYFTYFITIITILSESRLF